jgi:hypothetical protein
MKSNKIMQAAPFEFNSTATAAGANLIESRHSRGASWKVPALLDEGLALAALYWLRRYENAIVAS